MFERARLSTENLMSVRGMGRVFLKEQVMKSGLLTLPVSGICWEWRKGRRDELQTRAQMVGLRVSVGLHSLGGLLWRTRFTCVSLRFHIFARVYCFSFVRHILKEPEVHTLMVARGPPS